MDLKTYLNAKSFNEHLFEVCLESIQTDKEICNLLLWQMELFTAEERHTKETWLNPYHQNQLTAELAQEI